METKSTLWIVATIWANIIIVGIIASIATPIIFRALSLSVHQVVPGIILLLSSLFSIWLGVHSVRKKSIITESRFLTISFGVMSVSAILQLAIMAFVYTQKVAIIPDVSKILIMLVGWAVLFGATLFFLKRTNGQVGQ